MKKPDSDPTGTGTATSTSVDLGDDLLSEKTRVLSSDAAPAKENSKSADERVRDAEILVREGFVEDAKHSLHRVILEDPGHVGARKQLERIHELELKQIFNTSPNEDTGVSRGRTQVDLLIQKLDEDLGLELGDDRPELSLFKDVVFTADSADLRELSAIDKIDLGIAFLEMSLHDQAVPHLQSACRALMVSQAEPARLIEATALLAFALLLSGQPMDASVMLEPILRDTEIEHASKLDLLYLMGRAHEALKMEEAAQQWYRQACQIDPKYRDVEERLRKRTRS